MGCWAVLMLVNRVSNPRVCVPQVDCPNFIHVLQHMNSSHLYACGSYAYTPRDAYLVGERERERPVSVTLAHI